MQRTILVYFTLPILNISGTMEKINSIHRPSLHPGAPGFISSLWEIKKAHNISISFFVKIVCFPHLAVPLSLYLEYILRRGGILATLATLSLIKKVFPKNNSKNEIYHL